MQDGGKQDEDVSGMGDARWGRGKDQRRGVSDAGWGCGRGCGRWDED